MIFKHCEKVRTFLALFSMVAKAAFIAFFIALHHLLILSSLGIKKSHLGLRSFFSTLINHNQKASRKKLRLSLCSLLLNRQRIKKWLQHKKQQCYQSSTFQATRRRRRDAFFVWCKREQPSFFCGMVCSKMATLFCAANCNCFLSLIVADVKARKN